MTDLRALFEHATDHMRVDGVDLEAAVLTETRRRRRRQRALVVTAAAACVVLAAVGITQTDLSDPGRPDGVRPAGTPSVEPTESPYMSGSDGPASQPVWDPFDLARAPRSTIAFTELLGATDRLEPDIKPGDNPVEEDPMPGVVVAWPQKGAGVRLLGTDGRWRSAPADFETNRGTPYPADPPAISSDGTLVAVAARDGVSILDATTGDVTVLEWPAELAPPWDWAPGLRWLPRDDGLLIEHWKGPWRIDLDGEAGPLETVLDKSSSAGLGLDPAGPVYENDYRRSTLVTWEDDHAVHEAPFPQCERLVAAYGLVACTTGALGTTTPQSGPVVVDAATGEIVAYAPIRDPASLYSDNGGLTAVGFLDPGTVVLLVGPRRLGDLPTPTSDETWHLVAWHHADGTFERIATGDGHMRTIAVAPSLMD